MSVIVWNPFMVWAHAVMAGWPFCGSDKILSQDPPPPLKGSKGHLGQIQWTHMAGWLDVPGPPSPTKGSKGHLGQIQCTHTGVDFTLQLPQHCFLFKIFTISYLSVLWPLLLWGGAFDLSGQSLCHCWGRALNFLFCAPLSLWGALTFTGENILVTETEHHRDTACITLKHNSKQN